MKNSSSKQHDDRWRKADRAPSIGAASNPPDATSSVLAVAGAGSEFGHSTLCVDLASRLARRGLSVCLIDTDASLHLLNEHLGIGFHSSPIELQNETLPLEEILLTGPAGIQILPAAASLAEFIHLNAAAQQRVLRLLRQLERRFDQVLINIGSLGSPELMLPLLLAAPYTLLSVPAGPASLSAAFTLLKRLKHHFFERPLYVLVNRAGSLSAAHDAFRRLNRVTSRYLQLEIRYLGYVLSDEAISPSSQPAPSAALSASGRCLEAVAAYLLRQMKCERLPDQRFSDYFARLLLQNDGAGQLVQGAPADEERPGLAQSDTNTDQPSAVDDERNLRSAIRYASTLAMADTPD